MSIPSSTEANSKNEYFVRKYVAEYPERLRHMITSAITNAAERGQFYSKIAIKNISHAGEQYNPAAFIEASRAIIQELVDLGYCATYLYQFIEPPTACVPRYPTSILITWGKNKNVLFNLIISETKEQYPNGYLV